MSIPAEIRPTPQPEDPLLADLKQVLRTHSDNHPRSQQQALGPSEVGHPCARKLATSMLQLERINPESDCLPAWIGTAAHKQFEDAVDAANSRLFLVNVKTGERLTPPRWIPEHKVTIREGLTGTCDLYDTQTDTVIDLKFPGTTRMTEYRKNGPSPEYRAQAHLYGRGYRNEGYPVQRVGIWFIPRAGTLTTSFLWTEPYNDRIVDDTLTKIDNITILLNDLHIEHHLERLAWIPKTPHNCQYCPWWAPRRSPNPAACQGDTA